MADSINKNAEISLWPLRVAAVVSCRKPQSGSKTVCVVLQAAAASCFSPCLPKTQLAFGSCCCCHCGNSLLARCFAANGTMQTVTGKGFRERPGFQVSYWRKLQEDTNVAVMRRDFTTHHHPRAVWIRCELVGALQLATSFLYFLYVSILSLKLTVLLI